MGESGAIQVTDQRPPAPRVPERGKKFRGRFQFRMLVQNLKRLLRTRSRSVLSLPQRMEQSRIQPHDYDVPAAQQQQTRYQTCE